jgi:hypothetical protein
MLLRQIILYQKSYSQLGTRRSITGLATRMFRVILAFGGGIKPKAPEATGKVTHMIFTSFSPIGMVTALLRSSHPRRVPVIILRGRRRSHLLWWRLIRSREKGRINLLSPVQRRAFFPVQVADYIISETAPKPDW